MKLKDSGVILESDPRRYVNEGTGEIYKGITKVIREMVFPNLYQDVPEHILQNAAERGSRIHSEIEVYDMFGTITSEEVGWYAETIKQNNLKVLASEYIVTDFKRFASPIDKICQRDGKVYLADVKTTYKFDKEYLSWQLTFLEHLLKIVNPEIEIAGLLGIWINRKGEVCEIHEVERVDEELFKTFLSAVENETPWDSPYQKLVKTDDSNLALKLIQRMTDVISEIEHLKELEKNYKEGIERLFTEAGVDKWETEQFVITKTADYERTSLDTTKVKKELPEIFEKYKKVSKVKGSIQSKLK